MTTGKQRHVVLPAEQGLLLRMARVSGFQPTDEDRVLAKAVDWRRFSTIAALHRLRPLAHRNIGPFAGVPADIKADLARDARMFAGQSLLLRVQLRNVLSALADAHLRVLALKGPFLGIVAYRDASLREYLDLDIFVAHADIPAVDRVLVGVGYVVKDPECRPAAAGEAAFLRHTQDNHYAYGCSDKVVNGAVPIELHWALGPQSLGRILTFDEAWEDRRTVGNGPDAISGLSPVHLALHLAAHGAKHEWRRLEWLASFGEVCLQLTKDEWVELRSLAQRRRLAGILDLAVVLMAIYWLGEPTYPPTHSLKGRGDVEAEYLSMGVTNRLVMLAAKGMASDEIESITGDANGYYLRARESVLDQAVGWMNRIVRPRGDDLAFMPPALRRSPYYWFGRPLRLVWKHSAGRLAPNSNEAANETPPVE